MFEPSLVQYENPQLITKKETEAAIDANRSKAEQMVLMSIEELIADSGTESMDMLDVLMPPRIIEESGKIWYQKVSRAPASVSDLTQLQDRVDEELVRQNAREIGLCDIRRNIYDQLFDELIRQEIIVCPERGRLLRMIRRETELSLWSLINCYESGLAYGMKKKLSSYAETAKLSAQVTQLLSKISDLNDVIRELEPKVAEVKKITEAKEAEKQAELDRIEMNIKKENDSFLESLMECIKVSIDPEALD